MDTGNASIERAAAADVTLKRILGPIRDAVDAALQARAERWRGPDDLLEAMRYALFSGGKRIRPALTMAVAEAVGGSRDDAASVACALEMIHSYSLVHDDLPAMDDDVERRGQPTVHVKFGEAMAILAGDAMLTEAFAMIADPNDPAPADRRLRASAVLAAAAGSYGMVGGQVRDIQVPEPTVEAMLAMHAEKTGALFVAAARMGAILGGASDDVVEELARFGALVGKAFQLSDDLIDDIEDAGAEHEEDVNVVKLIGPAKTAEMTREAVRGARAILETLPVQSELLGAVSDWIDARAQIFAP